jgi:CheY-specific phosphatase CheX
MKENMKKIEEMMRLSISEVFEKMFFLFLEPPDDEDITYDMEAAIRFEGSMRGEVRVLLTKDMAKAMVQNMLGLEEDEIAAQRIEDCSKEAANMVCGDFLGNFDRTRVFTLSSPVFRERLGDLDPMENACRMNFDSGGKKVGVVIEID